ncbi:phospholipase D-like domain-containing protein [Arvimicrobium flavum]|uniref:phospholipase D-like domain-containing protein n=1 Tax=Arvimicrobium flavum TaxID=3393320 RepID=UPI00237A83F1|nr:phospholipase D-like domain-containing protein [Mesorhizobium shangrilense]
MRLHLIMKSAFAFVLCAVLFVVVLNLVPERRDVRQPIPFEFAVSDPQFLRTMSGIFEDGVTSGHQIDTLINGDEIFPAMLGAIKGAEDTVNFLTYIYWSGEVAEQFASALARKATEGVAVRVLLDWAGSIPFDQRLIDKMEAAGVKVHRFRPLKWYSIDRVNNRTHRKLLIVDGVLGFTGGVGVGDEWKGDARNPDEWRDNHYRVQGPVVSKMQAAFAENWLEATNEVLKGDRFYPKQRAAGALLAQHVTSSPAGGSQSMHQAMLMALAAAERHIRIGMGYFAPDEVMIAQLLDARRRGVEIDVLIPGEEIDVPIVRRASRHQWGRLLEAGIRIHEYLPTNYHTKVVIVDQQWTTIGSANFDERSFRLNDEANMNVFDQGFAQRHIEDFSRDLSQSRQVTLQAWQNRPLLDKIRDWGANLLRTQI